MLANNGLENSTTSNLNSLGTIPTAYSTDPDMPSHVTALSPLQDNMELINSRGSITHHDRIEQKLVDRR
eukprot:UN08222